MNTTITPALNLRRPDITTMLGEEHYKVPAAAITRSRPSLWRMAVLLLAVVFEKCSKALVAVVLVALALTIPVVSLNMAEAVAAPVVLEMRQQEVPQSGHTLTGDAQ